MATMPNEGLTSVSEPSEQLHSTPCCRVPSRATMSVCGVASAFPPHEYTQAEVGQMLGVTHPTVLKLLAAPHIQTRRLYLPPEPLKEQETARTLHERFLYGVSDMGYRAFAAALKDACVSADDIDVVVGVTSSALPLPGISAMLIRDFGLRRNAQRLDVVGMGCNAGMSGLRTLTMMLQDLALRRKRRCVGVMLCCEVNSAIYVNNNSTGAGVVNALFGDGSSAVVLRADPPLQVLEGSPSRHTPMLELLDFECHTLPDYFDDMVYDVDPQAQLLNFHLSRRIPEAMGAAAPVVVKELLSRHGLDASDVRHWVVHGGGAAVADGIAKSLNLNKEHHLRHTLSVLRDFGNVASTSFLISYGRLLQEHAESDGGLICEGDLAVLMSMGPGATIEVCLAAFRSMTTQAT